MPQGRHAQPDAVKDAKGSSSRRNKRAAVADMAPSKHGAPKELSIAAVKVWDLLAPDLRSLNFLRDTDRMAFARYCEHMAKWWKLTKDINDKGDTYETVSLHGRMLRINPSFLVRERLEKHLVSLEDRFGMNPAYRQQILQRMAGLIAAPPGDLFAGAHSQSDDNHQPNADAKLPSAIGILHNNGGGSLN